MLIEITYACKMGCSHCFSSCTPDGEYMSKETFSDALDFLIKYNIPTWIFSGGEMFEHPQILELLKILETKWNKVNHQFPLTFTTNGRELVRNKEIYKAVSSLQKKYGKKYVLIQVTDDERYYPESLTDKEVYWLKKLNAIVEGVPATSDDKDKCLYPQGRALENFSEKNWNTKAPKCVNCKLLVKQGIDSMNGIVYTLMRNAKFCTPVIAPGGSIKLGESAHCPPCASIYDDEETIIEKMKNFNCHACKIPWDILKKTNPLVYSILEK